MSNPGTASAAPASSEVTPKIADISYRNYDGPLITHALRWWVMAWTTIRQGFIKAKIGYWIIFAIIAFIYIGHSIYFYFGFVFNKATGMNFLGEQNAFATTFYGAQGWSEILLFVAALLMGSGSIASDNRANALLVYLSKPITRTDYLVGKWVGIFLPLLALRLLPNVLLYLFFVGTFIDDGFLKDNPKLFLQMFVASFISPAIYTSLIMGFSAWSKTSRIAGAIFAAFYFILIFSVESISRVVAARDLDNKNAQIVTLIRSASFDRVGAAVTANLYNITPQQELQNERLGRRRGRRRPTEKEQERLKELEQDRLKALERPPLAPVALLAGLFIVLPVAAAAVKVRAVEVIKG